jgi:hypothetical protein
MINYQNLAYCRWLFVWSFLFLLDLIKFSPLVSLVIIFILEVNNNKNYMTIDKRYGILLSELFFIIAIYIKSNKLYLMENICIFIIYCSFLYSMNTNVIKLHRSQLKIDDQIHSNESYWSYLGRIWYSFLINENSM